MPTQEGFFHIPWPTARLFAANRVRSQSKFLILGAAVVFALTVAACGGASGIESEGTLAAATVTPADQMSAPQDDAAFRLDYGPAQEFVQVARIHGEAIQDDPYDSSAYHGRAAAYVSLGRFRSAIVDLDQAIRLDSENPYAYAIRAEAYEGLEEWRAAVEDYDRAIVGNQRKWDTFVKERLGRYGSGFGLPQQVVVAFAAS